MNNEDPNGKREAPPRPTRSLLNAKEQEIQEERESVSLSPERISDGASTTTFILHKILEQDQKSHDYRHWGINE